MKSEWSKMCNICFDMGGPLFARIFYTKIDGDWKYLCPTCWEIYKNK